MTATRIRTLQPGMADYVRSTPEVLRTATDTVRTDAARIAAQLLDSVSPGLYRIDLVGSGTSLHAGMAVRGDLETRLGIEVRLWTPSEYLTSSRQRVGADTVMIGISQTGRSTGTLQALADARNRGAATVMVTGWPDHVAAGPAGDGVVDAVLDIGCGPEWVGARTMGYIATLTAMFALVDALEPCPLSQAPPTPDQLATVVQQVIDDADEQLPGLAAALESASALWLVSYGVGMPTAREAALKLLETVRVPVPVFDVEEYMHGPYHCLEPDTHVVFIAPDDTGRDRYEALVEFASEISDHVTVIEPSHLETRSVSRFAVRSELPARWDPVVSILPFQLLADELTWRRGREPGVSRHPDFHDRMASKTPAPTPISDRPTSPARA